MTSAACCAVACDEAIQDIWTSLEWTLRNAKKMAESVYRIFGLHVSPRLSAVLCCDKAVTCDPFSAFLDPRRLLCDDETSWTSTFFE